MRIGIAGVGRIGRFHAQVLREHPEVSSVVVIDADRTRAETVAESLHANVAEDESAMLANVDGVVICTPTDTHEALITRAVQAGVPVFCEKPVALDLAATRRVVQLVEDRAAIVQIGFQRRFDAGYRAARAAVAQDAMGRIYTVRIAGHDPAPPAESYIPTSGGIFRDLHIHDFDIARWVLGQEIVEVYAQGAVRVDDMFARHGDVDTIVGTLTFRDGTLGVMTGGRHNPLGYDIRRELFGSKDSVVVGWDTRTPMHSLEADMPPAPEHAYANFLERFEAAYRAELHAFVDVVAGRTHTPCSVADAETALLVALACDRSRLEHRPVTIDELRAI